MDLSLEDVVGRVQEFYGALEKEVRDRRLQVQGNGIIVEVILSNIR